MKVEVTDKLVDQVANLAKLEFEGKEKEEIKQDMEKVLAFIDKLNELDTSEVEPLKYMTDELNVLREDDIEQHITQEDALKNAPEKDSDYFKVPKVLSKE